MVLNFVPILPEHSFKGRPTTLTDTVIIFPFIIDRTTVNLETAALTSSLARPFSLHWKYICPAPHCFTFWPGIRQRADVGEVLKLSCLSALEALPSTPTKAAALSGKMLCRRRFSQDETQKQGGGGCYSDKDYFTVLSKGKEYCHLD